MFKSYILTMETGDQQEQQQHPHHGHHRDRMMGRGNTRPSPACSPVSSMEVDGVDPRRDNLTSSTDHHHNQHHKHKASSPWESVTGVGSAPNNVAVTTATVPASSYATLPSLKVQCVRPDSSEEESGHPSSHGSTLQRIRTEPFSPHPVEEVSDDDGDEDRGDSEVFKANVRIPRGQNFGGPPRLSPNVAASSLSHGRDSHHIPTLDGVNHTAGVTSNSKHRPSHATAAVVSATSPVDVTSVCVSRTGGVTSTTGSGVMSFASVENPLFSSSGGAVDRTSQHLTLASGRRSSGGSGSISCVSSSGVNSISGGGGVTVTVSSVSVSQTNVTASVSGSSSVTSASQPLRWEMRSRTDRGERASPKAFPVIDLFSMEKSDSSASSPLHMDIDENISSSPRSDRDNENRASCPKVPPLKIILPSQKVSTAPHAPDQTKNTQAKPALPYVLNPTQAAAAGEWTMEVTDSDEGVKPAASMASVMEGGTPQTGVPSPAAPPSRPSSRAGSSDRDENRNSSGKPALESSPLVKDGSVGSGKEDDDGNSKEEEEREEEARPTRTLRSHTAMKQQQEQKHQKVGPAKTESGKEAQDKASKTDQKGQFVFHTLSSIAWLQQDSVLQRLAIFG